MRAYHVLRPKRPESFGGRPAARTPARGTPAAAPSLAPGGRKCVRLAEVLPQRASASPGLSGRRGPWLLTLRTGGLRPRGDPEILKRLFGFWSGRAEKFRGVRFTATSGGNRGLVEPGRRRTRVRELQVPPWR